MLAKNRLSGIEIDALSRAIQQIPRGRWTRQQLSQRMCLDCLHSPRACFSFHRHIPLCLRFRADPAVSRLSIPSADEPLARVCGIENLR
jgi:hypothetical protein